MQLDNFLTESFPPLPLGGKDRLGSPPFDPFDRLMHLAVRILNAPVAFISMADSHHQFIKNYEDLSNSWEIRQVKNYHSFSQRVISTQLPIIVEDVRSDPRECDRPDPCDTSLAAYLILPLLSADGNVLGCFGVADVQPRRWSEEEFETLADLTDSVITEIHLRHHVLQREQNSRKLYALGAAAAVANCLLWQAEIRDTGGDILEWDLKILNEETAQRFLPLEVPAGQTYHEVWYPSVHPEDIERIDRLGDGSVREGKSYSQEFRCRSKDGSIRWLSEVVEVEVIAPDHWKAVGVCIDITDRKKAEEELQERNRLTTFVAEVGSALTQSSGLHDALSHCTEAMIHHLEAAVACIWIVNDAEGVLELSASTGISIPLNDPHHRNPLWQEEIGKIAQRGVPYCSNAVASDPLVPDQEWARREEMIAFAGYPLRVDERIVGFMALFARHSLTDHLKKAMEGVAGQLALAIQRSKAEEALRQSAIRDELTGLYNRREMYRLLKQEMERYRRYGSPFGLILMDVDEFKPINDMYGHHAGDAVLCWIGQRISETIRSIDRPIRHGGDELAILLPEASWESTMETAERLRQEIHARPFIYSNGEGNRVQIPITLSIGVATVPQDASTEDKLILNADHALYQAKRNGRNCVVSYSDTDVPSTLKAPSRLVLQQVSEN